MDLFLAKIGMSGSIRGKIKSIFLFSHISIILVTNLTEFVFGTINPSDTCCRAGARASISVPMITPSILFSFIANCHCCINSTLLPTLVNKILILRPLKFFHCYMTLLIDPFHLKYF